MANKHSTLKELFDDIADKIRAKTGSTDEIVADNFPDEIEAIPSGGGGSGGSVETCTVVGTGMIAETFYCFLVYDGTNITSISGYVEEVAWGYGDLQIENVVCGSPGIIGSTIIECSDANGNQLPFTKYTVIADQLTVINMNVSAGEVVEIYQ